MAKHKLLMQVELDIDRGTNYRNIREAALKLNVADIETILLDEEGQKLIFELRNIARVGLMKIFIDILNRQEEV